MWPPRGPPWTRHLRWEPPLRRRLSLSRMFRPMLRPWHRGETTRRARPCRARRSKRYRNRAPTVPVPQALAIGPPLGEFGLHERSASAVELAGALGIDASICAIVQCALPLVLGPSGTCGTAKREPGAPPLRSVRLRDLVNHAGFCAARVSRFNPLTTARREAVTMSWSRPTPKWLLPASLLSWT